MELIQFGSSLVKGNFSDIDVAVLIEDEDKIDEVSAYLLKKYPGSKVDIAPMYTAWSVPANGKYHFVVGTKEAIKRNKRLSDGVNRGVVFENDLGVN